MKTERAGRHHPFSKTCRTVLRIALILLIAGPGSLIAAPWKVHAINFSGNTVYTSGQLRSLMETKLSHWWNKSAYSHVKLESDTATLGAAYGQKGYLDAAFHIDSIPADSVHQRVSIFLSVVEGPQTLVGTVAIGGISPLHPAEELKLLMTKPNAPFSVSVIDQDAQKIAADLALRGHLYCHVLDSSIIDTATHRAAVVFSIDQGPLIFAGPFNIAGLKKVLPVVVTRELKFKQGDTLTTKRRDATMQKLYATGLFNFMQIKVPPESLLLAGKRPDTATEPVTATMEEAKFFSVDASAGYGTYDEFRGSLETRYGNLFGLGHAVTFDGTYNLYDIQGNATYTYPWILSLPVNGAISAYIEHHDITYTGLFDGIKFSVVKITGWNLSYQVWLNLEWILHIDNAGQDSAAANSRTNTQSIGVDLFYDTRKNLTDTTAGAYIQISPEFAGLGGRGTNQYYRALFDMRGYVNAFHGFLFSSAVEFGFAQGYGSSGDSVPAQIIYNLGIEGIRPVRGYEQNDLSPGGGRMALVINLLQVQHPVYKWIGLSGFIDGGYAWINPNWSDPNAQHPSINDLKWTVGPGIYVKTPVGQAEFDWGYLRNPPQMGTAQVHPGWGSPYFSIGQTF